MIGKIKRRFSRTNFDLKELLIKGLDALVTKVSSIVVNMLLLYLITRWHGAFELGVFTLCQSVLIMASIVNKAGLDMALVKFVAQFRALADFGKINTVVSKSFALSVGIGLLLSALFAALSPWLATAVFKKAYIAPHLLAASAAILPYTLIQIAGGALKGYKRVREAVVVQEVLFLLIVLLLVLLGQVPGGPVSAYTPVEFILPAALLAMLLSLWMLYRYAQPRLRWQLGGAEGAALPLREITQFAFPLLIISSLAIISRQIGTLMLGAFDTEESVAAFNVITKVGLVITMPLLALNTIAAPKYSEMFAQGNTQGLVRLAKQSTSLIMVLSLPALALVWLFPAFILGLFGDVYIGEVNSLLIISLGFLFNAMAGSVGVILNMINKQGVMRNIVLFSTLVNIAMNYVLIPRWGVDGAAFSSSFNFLLWNGLALVYVKKYLGDWILFNPLNAYRLVAAKLRGAKRAKQIQ